jgi:hypothetical protein
MSLVKLIRLAARKKLTVTLRYKPVVDGFTVAVQAKDPPGAKPVFERAYRKGEDPMAALDEMAEMAADFRVSTEFRKQGGRSPRKLLND